MAVVTLAGLLAAALESGAAEDEARAARIAQYANREIGYTTICRSNEWIPIAWDRSRATYQCYQLGKSVRLQELEAAGYVVELEAAEPSKRAAEPGSAPEPRKQVTLQVRRR